MKSIVSILLFILSFNAFGDYLIVGRNATLKEHPIGDAVIFDHVQKGDVLELLSMEKTNGYYFARVANTSVEGWIYQTLVRRYAGTLSVAPNAGAILPSVNVEFIKPHSIPGDVVVTHEGYISCISSAYLVPKWVVHEVSNELLQGTAQRDGSSYSRDSSFPTLKSTAYGSSGYDHGHLAPAADFKWSQELMDESFLMTNMSPQHGCMNQKGWCVLESNVRQWARENPESIFYSISGAVLDNFIDSLCINDSIRVYVPSQFYKIVIEKSKTGEVRGAGFLIGNGDVPFEDIDEGRVSIDVIESLTGINFLPLLNSSQETAIERTQFNFKVKNLPECVKRNSTCESIYSSRVKPEDRTKLLCR